MTCAMNHWAAPLIGKRWSAAAVGPDTFDCRGLVRYAFQQRTGQDIPQLAPGVAHVGRALHDALEDGWRLVGRGFSFRPRELDVAFFHSAYGPHVGLVIADGFSLRLLHCVGGVLDDGTETGEVLAQPLREVPQLGFARPEFWRKG